MITRLNPDGLADPSYHGYSQVTSVSAGMRLIFVAGQLGDGPNGERAESFEGQVQTAFDNLRIALEAAGATPQDVLKINVLVVGHDDNRLAFVSAARRAFFGDHKPASLLIPVPRLATDWMLFEIDAVAAVAMD